MNNLLALAAHNTVVALVLFLLVYGLTRIWRNPPVAHVLWLLVLLKLVAPPLVRVDGRALGLPSSTDTPGPMIAGVSQSERQKAESHPRLADQRAARTTGLASAAKVQERDLAAGLERFWDRAGLVVVWLWLGGAALCAVVAATRIVRFERLLRDTLPASERLQRLALKIAAKLGVRRVPELRYLECAQVPLLWCAGRRPTIVLPIRLHRQLDDQHLALLLAHELAHLRRRDHWVRVVELIVATVYWWNPLVWAIRRQIHQAEDFCCDAWVRWAYPESTKHYAEVMLKLAESLNVSQVGARLLPASSFLHSLSLKARIEMILENRFAPRVSRRSMFVIALFAALVLPSFVQTTNTAARAGSTDEGQPTAAQKPDTATSSEFPYVLKIEQGATRFLDGDKITIVEVRGTAETFTPGHIYWIKGTYTLASHDRAMVSAYTTAMDAANGTNVPLKVQSTVVNKGNGTFTLFLPMSYRGWPHVSFYPAGGGGDFGGNYFGTGDLVLKQWWGS
jgi:beta-lactamase regulating signal transducer with metallopeptidase domain